MFKELRRPGSKIIINQSKEDIYDAPSLSLDIYIYMYVCMHACIYTLYPYVLYLSWCLCAIHFSAILDFFYNSLNI
jgi:hypothetical protein